MNKTKTAQQLRLAAELIETGHPFEFQDGGEWVRAITITPDHAICERREIRPILATPPDGRSLHNPDGLSAEQVGLGYRLVLQEESANQPHEVWMINNGWQKALVGEGAFNNFNGTYRLPLSVPWPEAKPEAPPFQLPPPPPGISWHRTDGWKNGDLPQGYRPVVAGEDMTDEDEYGDNYKVGSVGPSAWKNFKGLRSSSNHMRTTRPLTFTHLGQTWTWHRPGDPMPCDGERQVCLYRLGAEEVCDVSNKGKDWFWKDETIIGWRYAETTRQVELGPEDVPPGSWVKFANGPSALFAITEVRYASVVVGAYEGVLKSYAELYDGFQINRSLPLTGRWNPDAWEPCHKTISPR